MTEKLWIYDFKELFKSFQIIPKESDSYYTKLNTTVRAVIIIGLVLCCWKPKMGIGLILIISMITIIVDAGFTKTTNIENFEEIGCKNKCKFNKKFHNYVNYNPNSNDKKSHLSSFINNTCENINPNFPITQ